MAYIATNVLQINQKFDGSVGGHIQFGGLFDEMICTSHKILLV